MIEVKLFNNLVTNSFTPYSFNNGSLLRVDTIMHGETVW